MLMNLGVGMSHELTARENIYISGFCTWIKNQRNGCIFDQIVGFAELKEFVDTKIKYYSSGMVARLGFFNCGKCRSGYHVPGRNICRWRHEVSGKSDQGF